MLRLLRWKLYGRKSFVNYLRTVDDEQRLLSFASLCHRIYGKHFTYDRIYPVIDERLQELGFDKIQIGVCYD